MYDSLLGISGALHLGIFQQPARARRVRGGKAILSCFLNQKTGQTPAPRALEQARGQRLGKEPARSLCGLTPRKRVRCGLSEKNFFSE
jgi:hypothetical protein